SNQKAEEEERKTLRREGESSGSGGERTVGTNRERIDREDGISTPTEMEERNRRQAVLHLMEKEEGSKRICKHQYRGKMKNKIRRITIGELARGLRRSENSSNC
ncbi:hypothetical protein NPIL_646391, partial [Nephila pilipes]